MDHSAVSPLSPLTQEQFLDIISDLSEVPKNLKKGNVLLFGEDVVAKVLKLDEQNLPSVMSEMFVHRRLCRTQSNEGMTMPCVLSFLGCFYFDSLYDAVSKVDPDAPHLHMLPRFPSISIVSQRHRDSMPFSSFVEQRRQLPGYDAELRFFVYNVLVTLLAFNSVGKGVKHNDLHTGNILVSFNPEEVPSRCSVALPAGNETRLVNRPSGMQVSVIDFELSTYGDLLGSAIDNLEGRIYGMHGGGGNLYDVYTFLNSMYVHFLQFEDIFKRTLNQAERELVDFIESTVPQKFLGVGLTLNGYDRIQKNQASGLSKKMRGSPEHVFESRPSSFGRSLEVEICDSHARYGFAKAMKVLHSGQPEQLVRYFTADEGLERFYSKTSWCVPEVMTDQVEALDTLRKVLASGYFETLVWRPEARRSPEPHWATTRRMSRGRGSYRYQAETPSYRNSYRKYPPRDNRPYYNGARYKSTRHRSRSRSPVPEHPSVILQGHADEEAPLSAHHHDPYTDRRPAWNTPRSEYEPADKKGDQDRRHHSPTHHKDNDLDILSDLEDH